MLRLRSTSRVLSFVVGMAALIMFPVDGKAGSRWGADYLPNVELVTERNERVRFYDDVIKGKIVVFSFIYTSCREICPLVTARMAQVYDRLGDAAGRDIHFVSISIDPENDTPERLKEHADTFRDDPAWIFLTGNKADIDLVRYKLGERSRKLTEHSSHIMLYNDRTGVWARDSAFADTERLAITLRRMDPEWRPDMTTVAFYSGKTDPGLELPGQALFAKACASCHTIGEGVRVGPDLKGVTHRRESDWLHGFIRSPKRYHHEKDPTALALARDFPAVRMPNLLLSRSDVGDLVAYLQARTFALESKAQPGGHAHDHAQHAGSAHGHRAGKHQPQHARQSSKSKHDGGHHHHHQPKHHHNHAHH